MKRSREPDEILEPGCEDEDAERFASRDSPLASARTPQPASVVEDEVGDTTTMRCSLPPHKQPVAFRSYQEYESHYNMFHTNRCLECRKNFPSEHLLSVHIEEYHDPLVRVRRDKGEHTYSCFVEGCERKCLTHQKRKLHMIDKHMYPKNFFFGVTKDGIDGRRSLLVESDHRRRRSSTSSVSKELRRRADEVEKPNGESTEAKDAETQSTESKKTGSAKGQNADADMADLAGAMSALQFVPPSVRFGRGGRAGFSKS
ncbi:hypothetical protein QQS21_009325 [Conoideocrella luteorostrata]|uniref:C2H2-type domain-containing protein n=1 Tax=Conoideocrella luteorostrata TaxID=1105319 RepID=A0AAJ0CHA5_9HYPO|nr:hypothetical protein QQS21_009325 [Conoideocrella luteorostrata]